MNSEIAKRMALPYDCKFMIIDLIVAIVVIASALISFMRGFIREVLTIAGVVGGLLAAVFLGPVLAPSVRGWFGANDEDPKKIFDIIPVEIAADITTYGAIFILVVIVLSVISHFISGAAKAVGLGPVDRTLGVFFGVARALILLGLVYLPFHLLMDQDRKTEIFGNSNTHYIIEKISAAMAGYLPDADETKKDMENEVKKRLEDQNLLGGAAKKVEPEPDAASEGGAGYDAKEREKLDELFEEPPAAQTPDATVNQ